MIYVASEEWQFPLVTSRNIYFFKELAIYMI